MIDIIKQVIKNIFYYFFPIQNKGTNNIINVPIRKYRGRLFIFMYGNHNLIKISEKCVFNGVTIRIYGNNNCIQIDDHAKIQNGVITLFDGAKLEICHNSTFQEVSINLKQERCLIGPDCMLSKGIEIRNHDGHKITNILSNMIINAPKEIVIGDHVWIGQNVTILKSSRIGSGSIIGCNALVAGQIGQNVIAGGIPAKTIKEDVTWIRH